jgi:hypothetical protein
MNGSGTTMLLDLLDSHSQIYGFKDETRLLPFFMKSKGRYDDPGDDVCVERLWNDMRCAFPFWKANGESCVPLPDDWHLQGRTPAQVFDWILGWFAAAAGKRIWCEKTPMHALHIAEIAESLPASRFIHIIRDGRDCAASFGRRWGYNPRVSVQRWKNTIRAARHQAKGLDRKRYTEVRFEKLTSQPEATLKEICHFLDVEFEEQILISSRSSARMRGVDSKKPTPNSGAYKTYFSSNEIAILEDQAGACLNDLGYAVENRSGDRDLSPLYVGVNNALTRFGRLGDIAKRARHSRSPFKLITSRIQSGIRHIRSNKL